jgi:perosamine synthetase
MTAPLDNCHYGELVHLEVEPFQCEGYVIPYARRGSVLGQPEAEAVARVITSEHALTSGRLRETFEARFAAHCGVRHALTVTSGTVALQMAVHLLGLRAGDEVIVTPQSYQATAQPLLDYQVRVRFCDIDPCSLNIDPSAMEGLWTERTRAVILVHYGGWPAEMDRVTRFAHARGAVVVEDCAHALGGLYRGRRPGALGDIGCFSFHASKNITTLGEGGMITVSRDDWAARIDRLRSNEADGDYQPAAPTGPDLLRWMVHSHGYGQRCTAVRRSGTNATLSEAACAVGLAQLDRLDELTERRRWIAGRLDAVLANYPEIRRQGPGPDIVHPQHLFTLFAAGAEHRHRLLRELDRRGVEVQLRYVPLHLMPEWRARGHGPGECPVAERLWFTEHVNLPCHPGLTDSQVDQLVESLDGALRACPPDQS